MVVQCVGWVERSESHHNISTDGVSLFAQPNYAPVMPAHSRSQNGVALLAYVASLHVLRRRTKSWMAGTSPAITAREFCAGKRENISSSTCRRIVAVLVTYRFKSRLIGRGPDAAGLRGEGGARARICNPLPGGFGHQPSTMTGARGARHARGAPTGASRAALQHGPPDQSPVVTSQRKRLP